MAKKKKKNRLFEILRGKKIIKGKLKSPEQVVREATGQKMPNIAKRKDEK